MNLFRNTCFLLPLALTMTLLQSEALQVVYPKSPNTEISASSTFFIGNTTPGSDLTINNKPVKVFENGSFVEVVPLQDGFNRIIIDSKKVTQKSIQIEKQSATHSETVKETEHDTFTYIIKKVPKSSLTLPEAELIEFPENEFVYAAIIKNNAPLRAQPDENAQRLTHLGVDTILMLNGKQGDYYRVSLTPSKNVWIKAENVVNYSTINEKMLSAVCDVTTSNDKLYEYIKTPLAFPVPFKIVETDTGLTIDLYNIKENPAATKIFKSTDTIKSLAINSVKLDNLSTYFVELNNKLWGYEAYYEGNTLVLKIRKAPQIDSKNPLKGLTIALDAGHGGADAGAIGPTGVKEKEINLDIAKKLQKTLENAGATVIMTRTEDKDIDLYERPKTAKNSDSLIMISLHANALADGANPYEKHGTSTYYYNRESVELAKTIRDTLVTDLGTKDDGVCKCSFVLTRPTMPLSVLVEVAYMIHPEEYSLLLDDSFRQKTADSMKKALENYLLNSVNRYENIKQ